MSKKKPFVSNVADEKQVKDADRKERLKARKEKEDIEFVCSDIKGRRWLWKTLSFTGIYKISYTGNSETFFNEGGRNVGNHILSQIQEHNPRVYLKMQEEALEGKYDDN